MNFDENMFVELSESDRQDINGGNIASVIINVGAIYCTCDMAYQLYKGFRAGWKAGGRR